MSITTYKDLMFKKYIEDIEKNYVWHKAIEDGYTKRFLTLEELLNTQFDAGFGGIEGAEFVIITNDWVYFPTVYDGAEDVGRVPRNPNEDYEPEHVGGG